MKKDNRNQKRNLKHEKEKQSFQKRAIEIVFIALVILILIICVTTITWTPKIHSKNAIAEMKYYNINGQKEWALIRGINKVDNPLLVIVHGGPGMPSNGYLRLENSMLEKYYTVVYWEQRGAGYSWNPKLTEEDMTVDLFISDLYELIKRVQEEIGSKKKVYLLGFSWGTIVGIKFAEKYPELVYKYIGVGQVTDDIRAEKISREYALNKAKNESNTKAIKELEEIGLPPYDYDKLLVKSDWARHYGAYSPKKSESVVVKYIKMLTAKEYAWPYLIKLSKGAYFSLKALQNEISRTNLFREVPEVKVPVVFLEGRYDYAVPSTLAEEYYKTLKAPEKRFYYFEYSGHSVQRDESEKFNQVMIELRK